jgi:hypothetical protein
VCDNRYAFLVCGFACSHSLCCARMAQRSPASGAQLKKVAFLTAAISSTNKIISMWVLELSVHINDDDVLRDTSQTKSVHKLKFSERLPACCFVRWLPRILLRTENAIINSTPSCNNYTEKQSITKTNQYILLRAHVRFLATPQCHHQQICENMQRKAIQARHLSLLYIYT